MWRIRTARGELSANFLVLGTGALVEPARPDIPGLDTFAGTLFHSARWNHDHDLTDCQIAVIGTGASAIQFVPQVAKVAGAVTLFQRTAPWVMPRTDRAVRGVEQWIYRTVPGAHRLARAGVYGLLESRALGFVTQPYPALAQPHVSVVTAGISAVEPEAVRTTDGVLHRCDTLILGTGFRVTDNPGFSRIRGRDGTSLEKAWADTGMHAHLGTSVPGFPNLFLLLGPNTGIGHTSAVYMIREPDRFRPAGARAQRAPRRRRGPQHCALARPHLPLPAADPAVPSGRLRADLPRPRSRLLR